MVALLVPSSQLLLLLFYSFSWSRLELLLVLVASSSWSWFLALLGFGLTPFIPSQSSSYSWSTVFLTPSSTPLAHGSQFLLFLVVVHVAPNRVNFSCSWSIALFAPSRSSFCSLSSAPLDLGHVTLLSYCSLELWLPTPLPLLIYLSNCSTWPCNVHRCMGRYYISWLICYYIGYCNNW